MSYLKIIFTFVAASVVLSGVYFITLMGPGKKAEYDINMDPSLVKLNPIDMLRESEVLETQFELVADAGVITEEAVEKLRRAVLLQEKYIENSRTVDRAPSDRLLKLQKRLQNVEAAPLVEKLAELEKEAENESEFGDISKAMSLYTKAHEIQSLINSEYVLSDYCDLRKIAYYDRSVKMLKARPDYLKSVAQEESARKALDGGDWKKAQMEYEAAIETVRMIMEKYPNSLYSDFSRLKRLEIDLDSLKSRSLESTIEEFEKKAQKAEDEGDYLSAAEAYADASEHQKRLNQLFPQSVSVSEEKVKLFDYKKEECFSWKFGREIVEQNNSLRKALYEGSLREAAEISTNLLRKSEQFKLDYPQNRIVTEDSILGLRYINYMYAHIPSVREMIFGNLLPLEGMAGEKVLKIEITQQLYEAVMQENPSRGEKARENPVDSVRYEDATRFCSRLELILARKVRLPSVAEYEKMIGSLRYANLDEIAWHNGNSGGKTHAVASKKSNDKGFYDLLGNVAEYASKSNVSESGDEIFVIGGGAQTQTDSIMLNLAKSGVAQNQRSRMVGFRIIVSDSLIGDEGK